MSSSPSGRERYAVAAAVLTLSVGTFPDGARGDEAPPRAAEATALESGSRIGWPPAAPITLKLKPLTEARLPNRLACPPERPGTFAGSISFDHLWSIGEYDILVTPDARIDIVQGHREVTPPDGVARCPGIAAIHRFELGSTALDVQITGSPSDHVMVTFRPSPDSAGLDDVEQTAAVVAPASDTDPSAPTALKAASTPPDDLPAAIGASTDDRRAVESQSPDMPALPAREIRPGPRPGVDDAAVPPPRALGAAGIDAGSPTQPGDASRPVVERSAASPAAVPPASAEAAPVPAALPDRKPPNASPGQTVAALPPSTKALDGSGNLNQWLVQRGDEYLKLQDIVAARRFYERAASGGSARAAMLAGQTYDPVYFAQIGVRGIVADRAKAIEWYLRAAELGDSGARERAEKLRAEAH